MVREDQESGELMKHKCMTLISVFGLLTFSGLVFANPVNQTFEGSALCKTADCGSNGRTVQEIHDHCSLGVVDLATKKAASQCAASGGEVRPRSFCSDSLEYGGEGDELHIYQDGQRTIAIEGRYNGYSCWATEYVCCVY